MTLGVSAESLAAEAYQVVRDRLLNGELLLGQVISRRVLARELGMSFLPVSEALLRLEVEGFLESRPRAGTRVRIPSREDVRGHYVIREALETRAAAMFARVATAAERAQLRKMAIRVDALSMRVDRTTHFRLHHKLHRRIAECTRCPALCEAIDRTNALSSTWFCAMGDPEPPGFSRHHEELLEALGGTDSALAARAMRQHLALSFEKAVAVLEPYFRLRASRDGTFHRTDKVVNALRPRASASRNGRSRRGEVE